MSLRNSLLCSALCAVLGACGGAGGSASIPVPATTAAVTPSPTPTPTPTPINFDTAEYRRSNGLDNINALAAYDAGGTGDGVIIGIIDSGIDINSSEFAGRIHPDSTNTAQVGDTFQDQDGHGTFVASVAAGDNNGVWNHGVAFDAQILALRTDDQNSCSEDGCLHFDTDIAQALDIATATGARVTNISLGGESASFSFRAAIDRATDADMIVVIAAGNDGASLPDGFARVAQIQNANGRVLIAGYVDETNTIAENSNRAGSAADVFVVAPGVEINATGLNDERFIVSGSSFAAPHVSGAIAVLYDLFPELSADEMIELVTSTATDLGEPGIDEIYGHGLINLEAALAPQGTLQANIVTASGDSVTAPLNTGLQSPSAFGDALVFGLGGVRAVSLDRFGRAYDVDLAPFAQTTPAQVGLFNILNSRQHLSHSAIGAGGGAMFAQVSIQREAPLPDHLLAAFSGAFADRADARTVMGRVNLQAGRWALESAFGVNAAGLLEDRDTPALISLAQSDAASFAIGAAAGTSSVAAQYKLSNALALQLDTAWNTQKFRSSFGEVAQGTRAQTSLGLRYQTSDRQSFGLSLGVIDETDQIFGAQADNGALSLGQGARTVFGQVGARRAFGPQTHIIASAAYGAAALTRSDTPSLLQTQSSLAVSSWQVALRHGQAFRQNDALQFTISQPQRVESGTAFLTTGLTANNVLSLSPTGRQIDTEIAYQVPFKGWGNLSANVLMRRDLSHVAGQHDTASFIRFTSGF